jgi:hypothetical protein
VAAAARAATTLTVPCSSLPCLGLAYVRHWDAATGRLHLLSPLPLAAARRAVVLVPWQGPSDVPAPLIFRAAAEGDPFCFHPRTVLAGSSAAAAASNPQRKQLKRRRLVGGEKR